MKHLIENRDVNDIVSIKDKIDWKLFNFLLDKLTEYEDAGYVIRIDIMYGMINILCKYETGKESDFKKDLEKTILYKHNVYYSVMIGKYNETIRAISYNLYSFPEEFYIKVKDKFIRMNGSEFKLKLRPR